MSRVGFPRFRGPYNKVANGVGLSGSKVMIIGRCWSVYCSRHNVNRFQRNTADTTHPQSMVSSAKMQLCTSQQEQRGARAGGLLAAALLVSTVLSMRPKSSSDVCGFFGVVVVVVVASVAVNGFIYNPSSVRSLYTFFLVCVCIFSLDFSCVCLFSTRVDYLSVCAVSCGFNFSNCSTHTLRFAANIYQIYIYAADTETRQKALTTQTIPSSTDDRQQLKQKQTVQRVAPRKPEDVCSLYSHLK